MNYTPVKSGKVREIYDVGESLILVATDRISAFDRILDAPIPDKGKVLTKMSEFWFNLTNDIVKNHLISTDTKDMPEFFRAAEFEGRSSMVKKLKMIPMECIVRGYLTGSGLASYEETGKVCGIELPKGLTEASKLPEPIFTPSTKAEIGDHDENVSVEVGAKVIEKDFPGRGEELAKKVQELTLKIYKKCADYAKERGIIIADTKLEFGVDETGEVVLGDEVLTPDSSRFWKAADYKEGVVQASYDKQKVRDYLKAHEGDFNLPQSVIDDTSKTYKEAYKLLTGKEF
ncbi:MAG: phosphoribosylaminoimidazolesuccinocarboxamide synthase [Selenomonadaceae bacterium]|nr:phosphoribosylaminoimidazolesuccinocarboxamide synthase [Selenomonadaceae bacterium]